MIIKNLKAKIKSDVPIIDVEIGNDISSNWAYEKSDIITFGIIKGDEITIIQREKSDDLEEFKEKIRSVMEKIQDYYAFNSNMERGALSGFVGKNYSIKEVKPWSGKGWNKNKFFDEILKLGEIIEDEITCPLNNDSSLCISKYNEEKYEDIIGHNLTCLLKEAYILKNKRKLRERFKDRIDNLGWWIS